MKRPGASKEYTPAQQREAEEFFNACSGDDRAMLQKNILAGLPGAEEGYNLQQFHEALDAYREVDDALLRKHLRDFIEAVGPTAKETGVRMAIHPDDPPFSIFGLPRVVSTEHDLTFLLDAFADPANGLCFCTGSLGVRKDNDLPGIVRRLGDRINFIHLRSTKSEANGSFVEADHLAGDVDMFSVMKELVLLQQRREDAIPFRPDHGHQMLDDLNKKVNPGYSAIGRLRGLAELRGLEMGIRGML